MVNSQLRSSFRDPAGFVFRQDGRIFRQINRSYARNFELLIQSGLYEELSNEGLLIRHEPADISLRRTEDAAAVILPEQISAITYPYEWCFGQYKDAALTTLEIQKRALQRGMSLKDASAFNIQFHKGAPVLIDTLSFEGYEEGKPWIAYRQFCRHFVAPLVLMSSVDPRLNRLMRTDIDGVPLDLASKMAPSKTKLNFWILTHLHLHAKMEHKAAAANGTGRTATISKHSMLALIDSLQSLVRGLKWEPEGTQWGDYYGHTNYSAKAMIEKKRLVSELFNEISPRPETAWDLGSNTGEFSRIASNEGMQTLSMDVDPAAVEKNYRAVRDNKEEFLLPMLQDLTNPSASIGWSNAERDSLAQRGPAGVLFALALIHHLAIGNNVPLPDIAGFFAEIGDWLIVEFVPKSDSQVQRMLEAREDIFHGYTQDAFEESFAQTFLVKARKPIEGTERTLYLMQRK